MEEQRRAELAQKALQIRKYVIEEVYAAQSGHPGGSLSIADVVAYLYFHELHIDPSRPDWEDRDRFVLSKGHCVPAVYAALAMKGFFPVDWLRGFRHIDSPLQGHPNMLDVAGLDMSTGSLGQGISAACGMALSAKIFGKAYRTYAILGDGELEEGEVWEAAMFAAHYKLDNLVAFVDFNGLQIDGCVEDVMSPLPIAGKFREFGWHVLEIGAHDFDAIDAAYTLAKTVQDKPTIIVARSVKGKGVSFMEDMAAWHGTAPNKEQYEQAMKELGEAQAKLEAGY
ncbi:transketolase [Ethanoligenens harbinense]|uniref:Transketolase domain-containing protein n=1 Tax=Ethanoligenens harbinense (strain DSM 18485 / JCM 12961 / CGMCC 1.5033 / YUAN-3) TaxID=663278 RepID=E6U2I3_ETHHY|nr:transketolase [Ethanoligenens harbinense]ADU26274.1 Transketolase domain-containing protein [Ethanoligenens harbinense YUAN-3]AVQ95408.1 transketolase [Ethanoligenens harbinense YUAN-3]AYF38073.1 transketolase [Ethanoligenens harbinense]AYF40818.1 transketolase [Ethanoligenens harbinense]QCN91649.1 transketolase [Ethanoligenens harbinense]